MTAGKPIQFLMAGLGLALAAACLYGDFLIFMSGEIVLGVIFLAAITAAIVIYSCKRTYSYRYLFPGLVGFALFVLLPLGYTVYIAFTNYSAANLLSLRGVQEHFLQETYLKSDHRYAFTVHPETDGRFRILLEDEQASAKRYATDPVELRKSASREIEARVISPDGKAPEKSLSMREVVEKRSLLGNLAVTLPDGSAVTMTGLRRFAPRFPVWSLQENNILSNRVTGVTIHPDFETGFYVDDAGRRSGPGFRVEIGFRNFAVIASDPGVRGPFFRIFIWNISFAFLSVFLTFAVGMFLAALLEWKLLRGRKIYRTLLILPYAVPAFISILIFRGLFNANFGEINTVLSALFGIRPQWTSDPMLAKAMILIVNVWLGYPYMMILCTGLLQSISGDLYEASSVDGSGALTDFFKITLPLVFRPLKPLLVASFAFNFNNFLLIYLLTQGRPDMVGAATVAGETDLLVSYTFRVAFRDSAANFGYASAVAVIIFAIVGALAYMNLRLSSRTGKA
ncbi:MAG: maltose ABC transporter permease MalF [Verrucomicrobia bacterium]|nr:maltose ABC transporter permease MalF [Verrucomicrobiota bacterium]